MSQAMYRVFDYVVQGLIIDKLQCRLQVSLLDPHCVYDFVLLLWDEIIADFKTVGLLGLDREQFLAQLLHIDR